MRMMRWLGFLFASGFAGFLMMIAIAGFLLWTAAQDLPSVQQLAQYQPPVMTRVHAANGAMLAEYAEENRIFVPISKIPPTLIGAFLSAEDKTFYTHAGFDWLGIGYVLYQSITGYLKGESPSLRGASTITQQVAKNFFLTPERSLTRKLKEAILTWRIERTFSKSKILELYLNQIFLGQGSHGVAAAALTYFNRSLDTLTPDQMAYLASLPKAPSSYALQKNPERALQRRNWVLHQMQVNGTLSLAEYHAAVQRPLEMVPRISGARVFSAQFFTEEVRRELAGLYGEDVLYKEGLSVRTTLEPTLQIEAHAVLAQGLIRLDRQKGWRGPLNHLDLSQEIWSDFDAMKMPDDLAPWRLALVIGLTPNGARLAFQGTKKQSTRPEGFLPLKNMDWARWNREARPRLAGRPVKRASDVLELGDVIYASPTSEEGKYTLMQTPAVEGALLAMDPHTGRVLALVGGFSYGKSQFNRAVQALRQPGSSIKPFVYAAALDHGYTPSSLVMDAPVEIPLANGDVWRPENYTKTFYGPSTLRIGIEKSRNTMTVNLANDMGVDKFVSLVERFGIYDHLPPMLSMVLGAGETTLLKMTTAYAILANGGKKVEATLIDRIQDRFGRTVFRHDQRQCDGCQAPYDLGKEPQIIDHRQEILNPYTTYQITLMLEGVVQRGTGQALKALGRPIAGKTGTSNDEKDAWFLGYTPDLVVGVYVGYDKPRPMGKNGTGGELAAPIVAQFMAKALKDEPSIPFRVPPGIQLIPINSKTGQRGAYGDPDVILEAFKPGQDPSQNGIVIGGGGRAMPPSASPPLSGEPPQDPPIDSGTGGLY